LDYEYCNGLLFNSSKGFFSMPIELGSLRLYQIGENILEQNGEMFEHFQHCNEISYIVSGQADFYVNGKKQTLKQGDIHIVSKGTKHKITVSPQGRLRYIYLGFDIIPDDVDGNMVNYYNTIISDVLQDSGIMFTTFNQFISEIRNEREYSFDLYGAYMWLILIYIYRLHTETNARQTRINSTENIDLVGGTVFNIVKYIDSNIVFITKVSDVADSLNYSHSYISRIFKSKMNMTIKDYINKKKIETATELIKSGKLKMSEISDYLHFDSYRSFNKVFNRVLGVSPSEYLKNIKAES